MNNANLKLLPQPVYDFPYDIDRDPVWLYNSTPKPFYALAWYQGDQLGTPMGLAGEDGQIAWNGVYKAWGACGRETQRQCEVGRHPQSATLSGAVFRYRNRLHYNRYRHYTPAT